MLCNDPDALLLCLVVMLQAYQIHAVCTALELIPLGRVAWSQLCKEAGGTLCGLDDMFQQELTLKTVSRSGLLQARRLGSVMSWRPTYTVSSALHRFNRWFLAPACTYPQVVPG